MALNISVTNLVTNNKPQHHGFIVIVRKTVFLPNTGFFNYSEERGSINIWKGIIVL